MIVYGILALYKPDILLEPFLANVYQFPAEATKATTYLSALYRLLGYLNIIPGMLGMLILYRYRSTRQQWYLKMLVASTALTYIGPVVFDNTVGTIGFFEVIELVLFMLVIISGFIMLKRPVEVSLNDQPFPAPSPSMPRWTDKTAIMKLGPSTSRFYETENDLQQMQGLLMEGRSRTDDWHYWHVGELMFAFFMVDCHLNPQEHIRLWHDDEGKLVGYAILGEDPSFDWQALPEYEWSGIESEAMAWAETRLTELRRREAERWSGNFVSGARQDNGKRIAFLEQHGFRLGGEFSEVNMLRSLDEPIPEAAVPAGCQVRAVAAAGEIPNRAEVQREVWQPWSVGKVGDDDYAPLMRLPGYHRDLDVVAVTPEGVIAAYVNGWIDPVNRIGDFGPVGARPAYRRQGLTRAVLIECLRRMKAHGMDRVCVSTGVSNMPARRLYESVGFRIVNKYLEYKKTEGSTYWNKTQGDTSI